MAALARAEEYGRILGVRLAPGDPATAHNADLWLVLPLVITQAVTLIESLPQMYANLQQQQWFIDASSGSGGVLTTVYNWVVGVISDPNTWATIGGGALNVGLAIVGGISSAFFIFILTIYFIATLDASKAAIYTLISASHRARVVETSELEATVDFATGARGLTFSLSTGAAATTIEPVPPSVPRADLELAIAGPTGPVPAGADLGYRLTVTNRGADAATGVVVIDGLPPGLELPPENYIYSAFWAHYRHLRGRVGEVNIPANVLRTHDVICAAVSFPGNDRDLRNGGLGECIQKFGAVSDDSAVLLAYPGEKTGNVHQR